MAARGGQFGAAVGMALRAGGGGCAGHGASPAAALMADAAALRLYSSSALHCCVWCVVLNSDVCVVLNSDQCVHASCGCRDDCVPVCFSGAMCDVGNRVVWRVFELCTKVTDQHTTHNSSRVRPHR